MTRRIWEIDGQALFPCVIDDSLAWFVVETSIAREAPVPTHQFFHTVSVDVAAFRESGCLEQAEAERLWALEDFLIPFLEQEINAIWVARVTVLGRRDFHFYASAPHVPESSRAEITGAFPDYSYSGAVDHDPDWERYFSFLYPNEMAYHYILLFRTLNDNPGPVPLGEQVGVTHYLYFADAEARDACARAVSASDRDLAVKDGDTLAGTDMEFRLRVEQRTPLVDMNIYGTCERLILLAGQHDGRYSHFEIESSPAVRQQLPPHALLRIAGEVLDEIRPRSDLGRFGVSLGEPEVIKGRGQPLDAEGLQKLPPPTSGNGP
ncbi:MAG: DUF695 domain-containing protein [Planctomycetota bacterium]|jgi:hypothetical protein